MSPDLVVLGNLLVDDVVLPDGRTRMGEPGGATLYASLGATLWGVRTGVVSFRGHAYPGWALEALQARGVDLGGVHMVDGPGLRTWLLYEGRRRRVIHHLDGPTHEQVSPGVAHVPQAWRGARAFHVAPMPFQTQAPLVDGLRALDPSLLSLDPHLPVKADTLAQWREVLAALDILFLGEDEIEDGEDAPAAAEALRGGRLALVVLKRGSRGGVACELPGATPPRCHPWAATAVRVADPTGAGDAFAAGVLAGLLRGDPLPRALARGAVSASFAVEEWGCAGLLHATPEQADARLREWFRP